MVQRCEPGTLFEFISTVTVNIRQTNKQTTYQNLICTISKLLGNTISTITLNQASITS